MGLQREWAKDLALREISSFLIKCRTTCLTIRIEMAPEAIGVVINMIALRIRTENSSSPTLERRRYLPMIETKYRKYMTLLMTSLPIVLQMNQNLLNRDKSGCCRNRIRARP